MRKRLSPRLNHIARTGMSVTSGFVHFPQLPEHVLGINSPSMPLEMSGKVMEVMADYLSRGLP
ncbi:MAG: pyroglutamyl-peptidase I [Candidatus Bathyarchaeota archaeon]|nr:pyroglutamyl-peptidase I [Candidatus Bathyarchaeota archaeon]